MLTGRFKRRWRDAVRHPVAFVSSRAAVIGIVLVVAMAGAAWQYSRSGSLGVASPVDVADASASLRNPLAYLNQRSPGARGSGALLQTKNRLAGTGRKGVKPHERVLSNVRYARTGWGRPDFVDDLIPPGFGPLDITPVSFQSTTRPAPFGYPRLPIYGGGGSGGGGGGGGGSPPHAVPEPGTWSMLILGIFLIGNGLRTMHRRLASSAGSPGRGF